MPDERDLGSQMSERELRRPAGTITQTELERVFNARRHWKGRAEAAEAERDEANRLAHEYVLDNEKAGDEIGRLREALTRLVEVKRKHDAMPWKDLSAEKSHAWEMARAALSPREDA